MMESLALTELEQFTPYAIACISLKECGHKVKRFCRNRDNLLQNSKFLSISQYQTTYSYPNGLYLDESNKKDMAKSIYRDGAVDALIQRIQRLSPDQLPYWGSMNATEMLHHCNLANEAILNAPKSSKKSSFKQRLLKLAFFHIKKDFPKGAKAAKRFDIKGQVDQTDFESERSKFIELVEKFKNLDKKLEGGHPVFGALNHYYWGRFVWKHLDHHLKQFGL